MQRNYLRGLLICLVPCLLAAVFALRLDKYKLGIDLAGGTILVYEINLERLKARKAQDTQVDPRQRGTTSSDEGLSSDEMNQLAAQIKRRIDPTDIKNVTVRPLGRTRFEIILPFPSPYAKAGSGKENLTAEEIEEVKRLISQMGVLEFRILANGADDADGIRDTRDLVDSTPEAEMARLAAEGKPPPAPAGKFNVDIGESKAQVEYKWVEIGREERESLGLNNAHEAQPGGLWSIMAAARKARKTVPVTYTEGVGYHETADNRAAKMLLFSRDVNPNSPDAAREIAEARRAVRDGKLPNTVARDDMTDAQVYAAMLANPAAVELIGPKKYEYFVLTRVSPEDSLKVGGDISLTANSDTDPKTFNPCVSFRFNGAGAQLFGKITRRNKPSGNNTRNLAIVLDDRIVSAPTLQGEITVQGQITGRFDKKSVDRLVQILRSGSLSAELREQPVSENTIGPTLGADTIKKGTTAIGLAFVAILAFMVFYYRFAGMVACIALFANLLLTIGFMVAVNAAFTLPGLAGLVLTLGMAVDANVLIYERLREERDKGANLPTAIRNGYDRAFLTIIDTHLTSIFTAIVLYTFGNDQLKGFAITLTVGLVISLFTSLYMTRLMFDYWQHRKWLHELRMMRVFSRPNVHPMKFRWFFLPFTAILTVLGLALFLYRGEAGLNVDFRGGTVFEGQLKSGEERALTKTSDERPGFRDLLSEENQKKQLNPTEVLWENRPVGTANETPAERESKTATLNKFVYRIKYADGTKSTVTLSQKPGAPGDYDEAAMAADVLARAQHLPDVSVEQTFRSDESYPEGKSRRFTIRTTEKQQDLVRVNLDRLLRDNAGNSLMDSAKMSYVAEKTADGKDFTAKDAAGKEVALPAAPGGVVELVFDRPTSVSFVRGLLERELSIGDFRQQDPKFTLVGDEATKTTESGGRYTRMKLNVSENRAFDLLKGMPAVPENATPEQRAKLQEARLKQLTDDQALRAQLLELRQLLELTRAEFDSSPEPERLEVFDSTLAAETRTKAFYAILASWIAILLYLWFRFGNWTFGLAAVLCLVHDLCFTLGAIAVCHYLHVVPGMNYLGIEDFKIDQVAVAALLTLVGYSVNEIIVNFARIREVRGKNPLLTPQMINDSVSQTLSRTILTSMTVLLVSLVLYIFGGEGVHLFAFVMVMGVLISTYSSIFVASPLLLIFGEGRTTSEVGAIAPEEPEAGGEGAEEEVVEG